MIGSIIFLIIATALIVVGFLIKDYKTTYKEYKETLNEQQKDKESEVIKYPKIFIIGAIIAIVIAFLLDTIVIIPTGYTGVRTTFGQIDNISVNNGINLKIPFIQKIEKVNNKQQDITFTEEIWSETEERTALYYADITVTYQINSEKSTWIYANVNNYKDTLLTYNLISSAIKTSSKRLSSVDATNRVIIEPLAAEVLQNSVNQKYGEDVVYINKVTIASADYESGYSEAISQKQKTQLAYEQQQIENQTSIEKAEAEAQVKKTQTQAEADATVIKAQGEKEAAVLEAQGKAEANKILDDSITEKTLKQNYLEKWDGVLPKVSMSDENEAIIDIGDIISEVE